MYKGCLTKCWVDSESAAGAVPGLCYSDTGLWIFCEPCPSQPAGPGLLYKLEGRTLGFEVLVEKSFKIAPEEL